MSLKTSAKLMVPAGTPVQDSVGELPVPNALPSQVIVAGIVPQLVKSGLVIVKAASPFFPDAIVEHMLCSVTGGSPTQATPPAPPEPPAPAPPPAPAEPPPPAVPPPVAPALPVVPALPAALPATPPVPALPVVPPRPALPVVPAVAFVPPVPVGLLTLLDEQAASDVAPNKKIPLTIQDAVFICSPPRLMRIHLSVRPGRVAARRSPHDGTSAQNRLSKMLGRRRRRGRGRGRVTDPSSCASPARRSPCTVCTRRRRTRIAARCRP